MILIATRLYDNGTDALCVDRLYRKGASYALHKMGGNDPETWEIIRRGYAERWLTEAPEQLVHWVG